MSPSTGTYLVAQNLMLFAQENLHLSVISLLKYILHFFDVCLLKLMQDLQKLMVIWFYARLSQVHLEENWNWGLQMFWQ